MKPSPPPSAKRGNRLPNWLFPSAFGGFLGLALLKFGNPSIMERWVVAPGNIYEFLLGYPWPIRWAWWLLCPIVLLGLFLVRRPRGQPGWLLSLPIVYLGWQCLAASRTVDAELTAVTLKHLATCVLCFYLGSFCLSHSRQLVGFWLGLVIGFLIVIAVGWEQHFGGLAATRAYFFQYVYPTLREVPPGYLKKMSSERIFSTLFYPNTLAGALLLLLPITLGFIQNLRRAFTPAAKWFLMALITVAALACLYWSASKAGWLLMLLLGLVALLRFPFAGRLKLIIISFLLLAGVAGFFYKYAAFFERGATSVSARFDYWSAALRTANNHPWFGTGPGTFSIPYLEMKRPESEPSKLAHNDYLEQASDSGWPAFVLYLGLVASTLAWSFNRLGLFSRALFSDQAQPIQDKEWFLFLIWLGTFAWALQGLVEFPLYIPALAWLAFTLLGWLIAQREGVNLARSIPASMGETVKS